MEEGLGFYVREGVDACGCAARAPLRRPRPAAPPLGALRAAPENAARFPGFAPSRVRIPAHGANKNGPVVGAVSKTMVGDEGFEPPALCV